MADDNPPQRFLLDLQFTPDDPYSFVIDDVMALLDDRGSIGDVKVMWMGAADGPIGNLGWPRTQPEWQLSPEELQAQDESEQAAALAPPPEEPLSVEAPPVEDPPAEATEQIEVPAEEAVASGPSSVIAPVTKPAHTKRSTKKKS